MCYTFGFWFWRYLTRGFIWHLSQSSISPSNYFSNNGKVSCSRKQRVLLMGLDPTTSTLRVRHECHAAPYVCIGYIGANAIWCLLKMILFYVFRSELSIISILVHLILHTSLNTSINQFANLVTNNPNNYKMNNVASPLWWKIYGPSYERLVSGRLWCHVVLYIHLHRFITLTLGGTFFVFSFQFFS